MRLVICNYTQLGINHQDMQNYQQKRKVNQQIWILLFHHNGTVPHLVRCFSHIYGGFPAMFADTEAWGSKWPATIPQNWSPGVSMSLRFHHPGWLLHHGWQQHQGAPWAFKMRSEILHHLVQSGANYPFCKGLSNTLWWPNCGWGLGLKFLDSYSLSLDLILPIFYTLFNRSIQW